MRRTAIVGVGLVLALSSAGCEGRARPKDGTASDPPKKVGPAIAVVDLSGGLPEQETH